MSDRRILCRRHGAVLRVDLAGVKFCADCRREASITNLHRHTPAIDRALANNEAAEPQRVS